MPNVIENVEKSREGQLTMNNKKYMDETLELLREFVERCIKIDKTCTVEEEAYFEGKLEEVSKIFEDYVKNKDSGVL